VSSSNTHLLNLPTTLNKMAIEKFLVDVFLEMMDVGGGIAALG
jgi:hypothetical protein